jgi:hypothetical protein
MVSCAIAKAIHWHSLAQHKWLMRRWPIKKDTNPHSRMSGISSEYFEVSSATPSYCSNYSANILSFKHWAYCSQSFDIRHCEKKASHLLGDILIVPEPHWILKRCATKSIELAFTLEWWAVEGSRSSLEYVAIVPEYPGTLKRCGTKLLEDSSLSKETSQIEAIFHLTSELAGPRYGSLRSTTANYSFC